MRALQKVGLIITILILIGISIIPYDTVIPLQAGKMLGVLTAVIIMLITEVFPIGITSLIAIVLMTVFGCCDTIAEAASGYTNKVLFFVLASFGISEALTVVPASKRLLVKMMGLFGKDIKALLLAVMVCIAVLSAVISNVAAAAVFVPIVLKMMKMYEDTDERRQTTKCFMIAIPVASMIGGMMTPAGSSINILAINLLYDNTGVQIAFVQWMVFGIPLAIVAIAFTWQVFIRVYQPCLISPIIIKDYIEQIKVTGKMKRDEIYTIVVVLVILVLWILSSWITVLDITVIALLGLMMFFIPGMNILSWKQFVDCVSWEAFFLTAKATMG